MGPGSTLLRMDVTALPDSELARRIAMAAPGEASEAEGELYARLAPRVRLYGLRHLRDAQSAADLMQQVLMMTIERLRDGKVHGPERLASYVLGMCRMVVLDLQRGGRRRERVLLQFPGDVPLGPAAPEPRVDDERLGPCLDRLAERERTVLVLTFHAERSALDVGRELALSSGNVRVIRHRALARLRACLEGEEAMP
jgi:RNA polymerase sigma-70 factor (ECF subfamily)